MTKRLNYHNHIIIPSNIREEIVDRCYNIILEDTSIERILERFYNLENAYHFISDKNNEKLFNDNEKLKEISNFIDKIYHEEKSQKENQVFQK